MTTWTARNRIALLLVLGGGSLAGAGRAQQVGLVPGVNVIAVSGTAATTRASQLAAGLRANLVVRSVSGAGGRGSFQPFLPLSTVSTDFPIETARGYIVVLTGPALWAGDPSTAVLCPRIATSALPDATHGLSYTASLEVLGPPSAATVTWELAGGALPPGVDLATDGTLSGTPSSAGTFSFTVAARNAAGRVTRDFEVTVNAFAVYFVSPSGNDADPGTLERPWRTIQKAAGLLGPGETVVLRGGTYRERVIPQNAGQAGQYITYASHSGETATIDGSGLDVPTDEGLFHISRLSFLRVSGLRVVNSAYAALYAGDSSDLVISHNQTVNSSSSGIGVWSCRNVLIDGNEIAHACSNGWQELLTVAGTDTFEVKGNHVHNEGYLPNGKEGICLKDGSTHGNVHHNHVHHTRAVGIYVDAWDKPTSNIDVHANDVHDCNSSGISLASEIGGLLEHVRLFNNLSHHNATTGIWVSHCCPEAPSGLHPMNDLQIVNNTVVANGVGEWGGGIGVENPDARNVVIRNNLCSRNLTFQLAADTSHPERNVVVDHNLVDSYQGTEGEVRGTAPIEGDPLFVSTATLDFHLQAGSPAIDSGVSEGAPAVDLDGVARPQVGTSGNPLHDLGAYELRR